MEGNKNKIIVAVVVVVVVVAVGWWIATKQGATPEPVTENPVGEAPAAVETPQGPAVAPGASPVSDEGKVVTVTGEVTNNAAEPGSAAAPQQSAPITKDEIPGSAVKIDIGDSKITPAEFTVKPGAVVTLAVTSIDSQSHVFAFRDSSLQAIATGLSPGETRAISFNAPAKVGEYEYYCNVPGHPGRGEAGKMIVK